MQRLIPRAPRKWPTSLLIAVAAAALAWALRALLLPFLGDKAPYATFFAAVILAGLFAGWKGGAAAAVLGGVAGNVFFVGGAEGLKLQGANGGALALYLAVCALLVTLIHSLTASLRREQSLNAHLETVSSEYRHRIKNLLSVIQALAQQTARSSDSMEEFEVKLVGRLQALSRAQDLLLDGSGRTVGMHTVVGESLKPFAITDRLAPPSGGPDVHVPAETAVAISLLLNELATNAAKYGALGVAEGRLKLAWTLEDEEIVLGWKELDGPPVTAPGKTGFGSKLIDRAIARAGGAADLRFEPDGVRCDIRMYRAPGAAAPDGVAV
jgi:two-component sensor histidine kinase